MQGHGEKFDRKQEQAIAALLIQPTIKAAAEVVEVSESTIFRWLQNQQFMEQYREARREVVRQATARLQRMAADFVNTLHEVATNREAPASSRVSAARIGLELTYRGLELEDLEERVEELENRMQRKEGK